MSINIALKNIFLAFSFHIIIRNEIYYNIISSYSLSFLHGHKNFRQFQSSQNISVQIMIYKNKLILKNIMIYKQLQ